MRRKYLYIALALIVTIAYLAMPACGSKSDGNTAATPIGAGYPPCVTGQLCNTGGGNPLVNGITQTSLDYQGSIAQLTFAAPQYAYGQVYQGPVNITGIIQFAPYTPCNPSPQPVSVQVVSQGNAYWYGGYAGSVGYVTGTLLGSSGANFTVNMQGTVRAGQDPQWPQNNTGYYYQGPFFMPSCEPTDVGV
jgi:hypothetical protein